MQIVKIFIALSILINFFFFLNLICNILATSSKDDLHRRIGGRCSTNNMKVVFKVCCAPEAESQNVTLSSSSSSAENEHTNSDNKVSQNGIKLNQYPQNSRGTSINTDNNDGRVPTLTINTQSTMTWRTGDNYNGGGRGGSGNGGPSYSTPISSTASVLQPYPHPTSSRPVINKNKPNNIHKTNSNYSNYTPSHKPTKKTSEYYVISSIFNSCTIDSFADTHERARNLHICVFPICSIVLSSFR